MSKRVVITGMGCVSPIGNTVDEFWSNIIKGKHGFDTMKDIDLTDLKVTIAGEVKNFKPEEFVEKKEIKRMDKFSIYAMAAAEEAVNSSGLDFEQEDRDRIAVMIGSGVGGLATLEEQISKLALKGPGRVSPLFVPMAIINMASGNVAIKYGLHGMCNAVVTACSTGTDAIGEAFRNIKHGYSDIILAGGAEGAISRIGIAGFTNISALTNSNDPDRASIPFDKERSGFVLGEGAGVVVLEEMEHAVKRGANIIAEVVGYGATCDAYHITLPDPNGAGAEKAMKLAINEAGITPDDVSYINAHGTSTPANDGAETSAIKKVFGEYAYDVAISSTKSMTGHLLGAAGAIEAIVISKALQNDIVPPNVGLKVRDPECDLNYTTSTTEKKLNYAISNTFGFGGHNGVLCFKKWGGQ